MNDCPRCQTQLKLAYENRGLAEMQKTCGGCGYIAPSTHRIWRKRA